MDTLLYIPITIVNGVRVPQPPVPYDESSFYDAKAVGDRIRLKSSNYQTLGFLDALRISRAAISATPPSRLPPPRLNFLTVSSTKIDKDVIDFANGQAGRIPGATIGPGVVVIQHVVCNNPSGRLGIDDLVMGYGIFLNPGVLRGRPVPIDAPRPAGKPDTLGPLPSPPAGPSSPSNPPSSSDPSPCLSGIQNCCSCTGARYGNNSLIAREGVLNLSPTIGTAMPLGFSESISLPSDKVMRVGKWTGESWSKHFN